MKLLVRNKADAVSRVLNRCLEQGIFSTPWKRARLVIFRKKQRPLGDSSSYRPLCMLDALDKLFKKIIVMWLK